MKYLLIFTFISTVFASPTWVESLRTGEVALQIEQNGKYYFRYLKKDPTLAESELCKLSVEENIQNIKRAFPTHGNIPMVVQLVYYDKDYKDCATTVVIEKSALKQKPVLDKQTRMLIKLSQNRQKSMLSKLRSGIYVGMSIAEVRLLLNLRFIPSEFIGSVLCYKKYKSPAAHIVDKHVICWSDFTIDAKVLGVCISSDVCIENNI